MGNLRGTLPSCFHMVAFTPGISVRLRQTIASIPTCSQVAESVDVCSDVDAASLAACPQGSGSAVGAASLAACPQGSPQFRYDVLKLVEFVRASRHLRSLKDADTAASAIIKASFAELHEFLE